MKNRKILYVALFILVIAALFPTAMAYMFKQTETIENKLVPAEVSCKVEETFDVNKNLKTSVTVKNTSNITAYIRVRVVSYWQDSKGNIVARPSVMPTITVSDKWIPGTYNTYYCKVPVAAGDSTPEFLAPNSSIALRHEEETHNGEDYKYNQVVEIFAEAIQSKPASAVGKSWNVTLDANNGYITGVKTTQNNN